MKVGMNAMNVHTVAYATQGLAQLIIEEGRTADGVAIAYDSRNNSELFAKTAARVLAAADIPAYLEKKIPASEDHPELEGCVPVDARLAELLQTLMDKYTFAGVDYSWAKLCYYYQHMGA